MRIVASTAVAAVLANIATVPASATITPSIGGPGGAPFELRCPERTMAVGIRAHAGAWIDGLMLLCSAPRRGGRQQTEQVGSNHSSVQEVYCPRGQAVRGLSATFTNGQGLEQEYLNSLEFTCSGGHSACIDTGEGCLYIPDTAGPMSAPDPRISKSIFCPTEEVLVGLVGRAGKFVDAVGAICGPGPGVIGDDRPAAGLQAPEPAYQDVGQQKVGDGVEMTTGAQALPSSLNPDVNASPSLPPSSIPATPSVSDGMRRNLPPPIDQPR